MPVVGMRSKNHRNDVMKRGGVDDATDDRETPPYIFDPLHAEHGFTLDAAAAPHNAKLARYFTREIDGLVQSWAGERVWCNPPYSQLRQWTAKALAEVATGCPLVVLLLPANRTEQSWWQEMIEPVRDREGTGVRTINLPGRARFLNVTHHNARGGSHAGFGCVVIVIEPPRAGRESAQKGGG